MPGSRCKRTRQSVRAARNELRWAREAYSRNPSEEARWQIKWNQRELWQAMEAHEECKFRGRGGR